MSQSSLLSLLYLLRNRYIPGGMYSSLRCSEWAFSSIPAPLSNSLPTRIIYPCKFIIHSIREQTEHENVIPDPILFSRHRPRTSRLTFSHRYSHGDCVSSHPLPIDCTELLFIIILKELISLHPSVSWRRSRILGCCRHLRLNDFHRSVAATPR